MVTILRKLIWFFARNRKERELDEELQFHIDEETESQRAQGSSTREAYRLARLQVGNVEAIKEDTRAVWGWPFWENFIRDIRYAFRMLIQRKIWSLAAIVSLSFGLGSNVAVFGILDGALLRKLPVHDPDDLIVFRWSGKNDMAANLHNWEPVRAGERLPDNAGSSFTYRMFEQMRASNQTLTDIFVWGGNSIEKVNINGQPINNLSIEMVSGDYHQGMGFAPFLGRLLSPDDDKPGAAPVAVISYRLWEKQFAKDPGAIGMTVFLRNGFYTIVGVAPDLSKDPVFGRAGDITIPLIHYLESSPQTANWWLIIVGRKKPNVSMAQVQANFAGVFDREAREEWKIFLSNLTPEKVKGFRNRTHVPRLMVMSASRGFLDLKNAMIRIAAIISIIFGIVLLVVCINITNLTLSRLSLRQREIAVRMAVGATRLVLIRQILIESTLLAVLGGIPGTFLAYWFLALVRTNELFNLAVFDWWVLGFNLCLALATGAGVGIAAAWRKSDYDLVNVLRAGHGLFSRSQFRLSRRLIVVQVAFSLMLVVVTGVLLRTVQDLEKIDLGFNPSNIALFRIDLDMDSAKKQYSEARTLALHDLIRGAILRLPGVRSVSISSQALLSGGGAVGPVFVRAQDSGTPHQAGWLTVDPNFFQTMQIPLKLGEIFSDNDRGVPAKVVVNQAFADRFAPNSNLIGYRFGGDSAHSDSYQITGVVANAKLITPDEEPLPTVYVPLSNFPKNGTTFAVRTAGNPALILPAIREAVRAIDPTLVLMNTTTQRGEIDKHYLAPLETGALVVGVLAALVTVIAMTGLFGLMSHLVTQRTMEIGVRMSLGADSNSVLRAVLYEALTMAFFGVACGIGGLLALQRLRDDGQHGLHANDLLTLIIAVALMIGVSVVAAYWPARRASQVDPLIALRYD
jgi:predicted permease